MFMDLSPLYVYCLCHSVCHRLKHGSVIIYYEILEIKLIHKIIFSRRHHRGINESLLVRSPKMLISTNLQALSAIAYKTGVANDVTDNGAMNVKFVCGPKQQAQIR